jgi:hypothetical protein
LLIVGEIALRSFIRRHDSFPEKDRALLLGFSDSPE